MRTRAITGIFFVAVMLGSFFAGPVIFSVFYGFLAILCLQEFYGLLKKAGLKPNIPLGLISGAAIYASFAALFHWDAYPEAATLHKLIFLLVLPLAAILVNELYRDTETPFANIGYTYLGIILTILPFTFYHTLGFVTNTGFDAHVPMAFLIMLWANDTGAYLTGRQFGRAKLFERHSPKKTWEGFIGGILIAAVVGYILSIYFKELEWRQWVSMAIIIGIVGTLGDLVESMFKRSINVKDSGGLLPGHGGLLDRFDGLLLAAPVVFVYLYFVFN
ncbi:phosphatidate cytidylyltransferase [Mucilaginibacter daejeonensis]|uniref:phosphatidate cytidylyltransferase n=1 Tax=Mucilaginibacter daejeonensis TaxID=398049 RepID=UPI001D178FAC|nr:phosphatidate cytidylyltransferase [Mucilaginibacter daejeonensis]UEG53989.1 phosphatidate cytidylyltransferase [Mucilaginibacter daejeonensis]